MSLSERKKALRAAVKLAVSCLEEVPQTDYFICVISRDDDNKGRVSALASNLSWRDPDEGGKLMPPSIGMAVDHIVDAKMILEIERFDQSNWRESKQNERDSTKRVS